MAAANVMSQQSSPVMPKSHVGFDSITSQIERKLLKRGFQFNVICVGMSWPRSSRLGSDLIHRLGQTGLGKSTLINTIFASHLIDSKGRLTPSEAVRSTTEIHPVSHGIIRLAEAFDSLADPPDSHRGEWRPPEAQHRRYSRLWRSSEQ